MEHAESVHNQIVLLCWLNSSKGLTQDLRAASHPSVDLLTVFQSSIRNGLWTGGCQETNLVGNGQKKTEVEVC